MPSRSSFRGPLMAACVACWGSSLVAVQAAEPATADPQNEALSHSPAEDAPTGDAGAMLETIPVRSLTADVPDEPTPEKNGTPGGIEEIVVTATKRAESVREIPASITALRGDDLERQGVQGAEELVKLVPGVNMTTAGDSPARITIRGISADPATNATTAVIFGDVSFTDNYLPFLTLDPNPFDLRTVEVLKGPQGTLFGTGALNGAIRYVPEAPELGIFSGKYFVQYQDVQGGGDDPNFGGAINVPLGEDWAARVVAFDRKSPGFIDDSRSGKNDVNQLDQTGARGIVRGEFAEAWDLRVMYAWQETKIADTPIADNIEGRLEHHNRPRPSPQENYYWLGEINLAYEMEWADWISGSAYVVKDGNQFIDASSRLQGSGDLPLLGQRTNNHSQTWSQEFRLVSADDALARWKWVVGVVGTRQDIRSTLLYPLGDATLPIAELGPILEGIVPGLGALVTSTGDLNFGMIDNDVRVEELAAFGDFTRRLGEQLELSVGGRLYRTTSGGVVRQSGILLAAANGELLHENRGEVEQTGFNPKTSVMWHVTDATRLYAAASHGFRAGGLQPGFNAPGSSRTAPDRFKADSLWNYELGWRSDWFDGAMHLDLTGFFSKWKDPQTLQVGSGIPSSYLDNAGGVESRGIEGALQTLLPIEGLSFVFNAAYTKTETTKEFLGFDDSMVPVGTAWPYAPRWQTATTLAYAHALGAWELGAGVTHLYLGKASNDVVASRRQDVFGFEQWNLQFNLARPSLTWMPELSVVVDNLADERGISFRFDGNGYTDVAYIRPRAVTLRLAGHF